MPRSSTWTTATRSPAGRPRRWPSVVRSAPTLPSATPFLRRCMVTRRARARSGTLRGRMAKLDLAALARVAEAASEAARREILPRWKGVAVETKKDGTPVTEADRAAERAIRALLREATPEIAVVGEEYGGEAGGRHWLVDPIDGTIAFTRGLPLFGTLIALVEDGVSQLGLIDLHALGERTLGWRGGGVRCNGEAVRCSQRADLESAIRSEERRGGQGGVWSEE